jgi:hypothetical protein
MKLERVIGFEPMVNGSADRRLSSLATPACRFWILDFGFWIVGRIHRDLVLPIQNPKIQNGIGAHERIRTFINLFLRQAPLPFGLRVLV